MHVFYIYVLYYKNKETKRKRHVGKGFLILNLLSSSWVWYLCTILKKSAALVLCIISYHITCNKIKMPASWDGDHAMTPRVYKEYAFILFIVQQYLIPVEKIDGWSSKGYLTTTLLGLLRTTPVTRPILKITSIRILIVTSRAGSKYNNGGINCPCSLFINIIPLGAGQV